jgi:hypothetical protein
MLDFIRRFIDQDFTRDGFSRLFGNYKYEAGLNTLKGLDRDDAIAEHYCNSLHNVCGFNFVQRAIVIHPDKDQPDFELIYGTRHPKGVEVFKRVEQQAMEVQEQSRARVESQRRIGQEGGQQRLFDPTEMPESHYYMNLRNRYLLQTRVAILDAINRVDAIRYDELWALALSRPLVWKPDLDGLLKGWCDKGMIEWRGRTPSERTFKREGQHFISRKVNRID